MKPISRRDFLKTGCLAFGSGILASLNYWPQKATGAESNNTFEFTNWKHKIKAKHWTSLANAIRCDLCPNKCRIRTGNFGLCRTRINFKEELFSIAYGNPCAVQVDPIEKKPLFHFLPASKAFSIATAGCNLSCLNCQNWNISQSSPTETRNLDLPPQKVVDEAIQKQCASIAYTYTEPIVFYEYMLETAKIAKQAGIKNILKSSGYIHEKPLLEIAPYLDGANIDLKSFSEEIYQQLNAGSLSPVLNTLKILKQCNIWLEITNLIIPSWTDDAGMILQMCQWLMKNGFEHVPLHFSRFTPMHRLSQIPPTPVETLVKAREISLQQGLQQVFIGNVPGKNYENTHCPNCHKMLIERIGFNVVSNILKDGNCPHCKSNVPGVWK